jgi:putative Mg2+ transporter-C (MgtC) family protein
MDVTWVDIVVRIVVAMAVGAVIGFEREFRGKVAGMRTHVLISLGAAAFTLGSLLGFEQAEMARVAAGVVAGVGFIGGGVIFRGRSDGVEGLTTAAAIWVTAGVGLAAACGLYLVSILVTILTVIALELPKLK